MHHFCTISTTNHLFKALALFDSIKAQADDAQLHLLIVDAGKLDDAKFPGVVSYGLKDVMNVLPGEVVVSKYSKDKDKLRWALKPVFLKYLLAEKCEKAVYVDNDIYFFSDFRFLFEQLESQSFLLTPHNYPRNPKKEQIWLEANFRVGLYNAGFVGVSRKALAALDWWAECCAYKTERNAWRGLHDDQKYLDLIPVMLEDAHIVRHKGCNVADWNNQICPRVESGNEVLIDGIFPLVFIHFNVTTIRSILTGKEPLLLKYFERYLTQLKVYKPGLTAQDLLVRIRLMDKLKLVVWDILTK